MTCYMRQMSWLFEALGLPSDKQNRKRVDVAIRDVLGLGTEPYCPEVWAAIKALPEEERTALPSRVRGSLGR
jgi:hypothetical protein